jgi:hypothetical protein
MAFNRKDRERRGGRDPFAHLRDERAEAEDGDPWFLSPDEGPDIDVQAGVSSNLRQDDLGKRVERSDRTERPDRADHVEHYDRAERAERPYPSDKATEHPRPTPPLSVGIPPAPVAPPVAWADPPMTHVQSVVVPPPERLPEPLAPPMPPPPPALPELPDPPATQLQPAIPVDDEPLAKLAKLGELTRRPEPAPDHTEALTFEPATPAFEVPGLKVPEPIPVLAEPFDFAAAFDERASSPDDPVDYASEINVDVLSAAVAALGRNKPNDEPARRPSERDVPPTEEMNAVEQDDVGPMPEADQP